jgi:hypothetical protein
MSKYIAKEVFIVTPVIQIDPHILEITRPPGNCIESDNSDHSPLRVRAWEMKSLAGGIAT